MKTNTLLLLALTSLSINAEELPGDGRNLLARLSLNEVTRAVLDRNPAIQQALRKWAAAKQRVTQQAAWEDVKVSGNTRAARFVDVAPNSFTDQMVSVEQIVPITGKNFTRTRIASADAVVAFEQARREQLDVVA